jgi:hypothetical protein
MNWPEIFLASFTVGLAISVLSMVSGALHLPHFHAHLPHGHSAAGGRASDVVNLGTIAAFLLWFGGAGWLMTRYTAWQLLQTLSASILMGLVGASIVFAFVAKVLVAHDKSLDPADYEMVGTMGRVSSPVRAGGTGEMIFTQQGRRCGVPVRSETGGSLARDVEVVVTRFEKGIAYVRSWDDWHAGS